MAANPPPYPPPYSERDLRRQARDFARAQRDQARAQRQYWRYWYGGYRRSSIVGPCILLAVGIIALMVETGRLNGPQFWSWYAHWWPVLLIGIGLVSLAEYFWDRNNPYAGHRSVGGIVFLILILALFGWGSNSGHWWGPFNDGGDDFFSMMGEEHDNDVQMEQEIATNGTVNIQNPHGDVTVTTSDDGQMHVRAHQVVHASDKDAAKMFDAVKPNIVTSGSGAVITVPSRGGTRVDLTIQLPEKSLAVINAGHGDVTVEGLKNNVDVTAGHGDVKFDSIGGDVHARMSHGDVSAHEVAGHAFVDGYADDVTLSEIKGPVVLNGDFYGDTHLEQVGSTVHFHSSRTDLDFPKLGGDMTMDKSDLTANQISGPVRLLTHSKNIDLSQVTGDIHIDNSDGDVNIVASNPLGNVQIANRSGGLSLTVPENANFSVTASTTEDNDLETDFPLQITTSGDRRTAEGTVGHGGVRLDLSTSHGNLELKKGSAQPHAEAPERPERPEKPEKPEKPETPQVPGAGAKHLKATRGSTEQPTEQ
jgi:DUF4097 and DUF4098 domain-containing protein YvlB